LGGPEDVATLDAAAAAAAVAEGISLVDLLLEVMEAVSLDRSYSIIIALKFCC